MERPNDFSSTNPEYIQSTLSNMKINLSLNLEEIKKVEEMLEKSSKGILEPVRRLNSFFMRDIKYFKAQYEEILEKVSKKFLFLDERIKNDQQEEINISTIHEECALNLSLADNHPKLNEALDRSIKIVGLFNNLFNTKEFDNLIREFNAMSENLMNSNQSNIINTLMGEEEEEGEKEIIKKNKNKKKLLHKKRKRLSENNHKQNGDVTTDLNDTHRNGKIKSKKNKSSQNSSAEKVVKNKISDEECVEVMKKAFPEVKFISKTFLTRKLTKTVTWRSEYDFNDEDFEKNQKEIVKSATYKYLKITLSMQDLKHFDFESNLVKIFTGQLKNYMIKLDYENKIITVAGDLDKMELEDFLKSVKDSSFKENYSLVKAKVEVYAFFEELFFEFESDELQIFKNLNDDEIEKIKSEWDKIKKLRVKWRELKGISNKD
jgi:hypothetical protein